MLKYEQGVQGIPTEDLKRLADALSVNVGTLFPRRRVLRKNFDKGKTQGTYNFTGKHTKTKVRELRKAIDTLTKFIRAERKSNVKTVRIKMGAPRKVFRKQLVKIQPRQSLANSLEQTIMLRKVTSVVKLMEWTMQGTTKVKVLSSEIFNIIEVDIFHLMEDSMKGSGKASYHSLYRNRRPYHVLRWILNELGRSFVFLLRYVGTSQQRQGPTKDTKEVGLTDSTQSVGKPHTRGSGQQYSNWFRGCYPNTAEVGI